jgi:bifunctional lysine-specific demethylase and histidyl-hydroxylase NO66
LVRFCRSLAIDLGHRTQCNAYITPPGSQGFAAHYDTHDVFVLQVEGHKRWNVHSPALPLPLKSQPSKSLSTKAPLVPDDTPPLVSVVLRPGDSLYLPRGFIHEAETTDDRSIHLTVGITATTAYDALLDVIALAAGDAQFRQALPLGSAEVQLASLPDIVARAAQWLGELPADRLQDAVRERVATAAVPEPLGMLASQDQLHALSKQTVVRPREGLRVDLIATGDRVVLRMTDRELSLPSSLRPVLESLLTTPCRVDELDLPVDDALVLVRRLLREGVVTAR